MTLDLSALEQLAGKTTGTVAKKRAAEQAKMLVLDDLKPGTYLAADPSITAFGLVLFEVTPEGRKAVHLAQRFGEEAGEKNWEDFLQRAQRLQAKVVAWIAHWVKAEDWGAVCAVHEMPPMGGGKMNRPEASLVASLVFRNATTHLPMLPMVGRQAYARAICGNANSEKKIVHAALKAEYMPHLRGSEIVTNEATRDALCVGLHAAWTRS